jgi:hypothetical protein
MGSAGKAPFLSMRASGDSRGIYRAGFGPMSHLPRPRICSSTPR